MSEITINAGILSIPEGRLWRLVCWLPRKLAGTPRIESRLENLHSHLGAMTDIIHVMVAELSGTWAADKRERVQRMIGNFTVVNKGLGEVIARGNPFTQDELSRLQFYTQRAQMGQVFTPEDAQDFRQLSERASVEYPGQDWVRELLKIAWFIFALYAIGQILKSVKRDE